MSIISRVRARTKSLTADEWIITLVTAGIMLPEYAFAVIVCLATIFALVHPAKRSGMMEQPGFFVALMILPAALLPAIISNNVQGLIYGAVFWIIIMFTLYASSIMTKRFLGNILDLILLISVVASALGILDRFIIGTTHDGVLRTTSIFVNANHYGYAIELFAIIAVGRFLKKKNPIYIVLFFTNLASLVLCDCRTAWAAIGVAVVMMLLFTSRSWKAIGITFAAGIVCCAAVLFALPIISPRFSVEALTESYANRFDMWVQSIEWIGENPIFGYGMSSYEMLAKQCGVRVLKHAHNMPLNSLLDIGVLGTSLLLGFVFRLVKPMFARKFRNKYNYVSSIMLGTIAATLIHGLLDVPILGVSTSFIFVMIFSSNAIMRNETSYGYAMVPADKQKAAAATPVGVGAATGSYYVQSMGVSSIRKLKQGKLYTMSNDGESMPRF